MGERLSIDKILKKEVGIRRRTKIIVAVVAVIFIILTIHVCMNLYSFTTLVVEDQTVRNVTNISELNNDSVKRAIVNRSTLLELLAHRLERRGVDDIDAAIEELYDFGEYYDFYKIGIMDKDRTVRLTDGTVFDASGTKWANEIWDKEFHITESIESATEAQKTMINIFTYPVLRDGEVAYVITAGYYSRYLTERMNLSAMQGKGYTFLLNSEGEVVIFSDGSEDEEYDNLVKGINAANISPDVKRDRYIDCNGETFYAHFEELGINGWYFMTCMRKDDLFQDANDIISFVFLGIGMLWLVILLSLIGTAISIHRSQKLRIKSTYYDELIGICNGNAMEVVYKNLPEDVMSDMYLVVLDVDKFKEFNYIYGAENGDRLLKYIASIISEGQPEAYLFRYMSDFFVIMDHCENAAECEKKGQQLEARIGRDTAAGAIQPFEISAGVRKMQYGEPLGLALSDAIIARDTIKGDHLRHYVFYDGAFRDKRLRDMAMESEFPNALQNEEFHVYYQPKYEIRTGRIIGAEALVRWIKPNGSIISPGAFIPCFEESRQIVRLDEEVLRQVCTHMTEMISAGIKVQPVSVNLSRVHLRYPDILDSIERIIADTGADPTKLSFEITESALLETSIPVKAIIDRLHELGCQVEMDDYGVGASNIDALISNSFDTLKLDKSFVDRIGDDRAEDMIRSTTHMAIKWGMNVLAEGVEEKYQAERLVELGCPNAQGYYYSRPVPEEWYRGMLKVSANADAEGRDVPLAITRFPEEICTVLDSNLTPIYIIDPDNFAVVYCNQVLRDFMGVDPTGGLCYKKLRGREEPCEGCSAMRLYRDGDSTPKEIRGPKNTWIHLQTSPLHWLGKTFIQLSCVNITKRKQLEDELRLRNEEYDALVRQSITGIIRYDIKTDTATVNVDRHLNRVAEYTIKDYSKIAENIGMVRKDSLGVSLHIIEDIKKGLPSKGYDMHLMLDSGEVRWCHSDYVLINDPEGKPIRALISFYDNTDKMTKEIEYQSWSDRLKTIVNEFTAYMEVNLTTDEIEYDRYPDQNMHPTGPRSFSRDVEDNSSATIFPEDVSEYRSFLNRERLLGSFYAGQSDCSMNYRYKLNGSFTWVRTDVHMIPSPTDGSVKAVIIFNNIDEEVREKERLEREAEHDSMTGLYNHAATEKRIRKILEQKTDERCCFLMIDLDDLRGINNRYGHAEGDKALIEIARVMTEQFGESVMGRIGGDEFVVLLRDVSEQSGLRASVSAFMQKLRDIHIGPRQDKVVRVSVGGAVAITGKSDYDTLYRQADRALYYTKSTGKNAFNLYVPELEEKNFSHQTMSTVTLSSMAWYEAEEFRKMLKAMSTYFPLVISVNLTKNTFYMMEYMSYASQRADDEGCFDQLIADGSSAFHPDDRGEFLAHFSRENLLKAYAEGKPMVSYRGRQKGDDEIYRIVNTVVVFVPDEETGDICEITFTNVEGIAEDSEE